MENKTIIDLEEMKMVNEVLGSSLVAFGAKIKQMLFSMFSETGEDYRNVAPSSSNTIMPSVWAKKGKLKGASLKISISTYYAVEHFHAEGNLTKQKN